MALFSILIVPNSCQQYNGDAFISFVNEHLNLNQRHIGCEAAVQYLPNVLGLKFELVCDRLVDSILNQMPITEEQKVWIQSFYDDPGVGIDRNATKMSDICGCSCSS